MNPKTNPFASGLARDVVLRLLQGTHTAADRTKYYRTDWWRATKHRALKAHGRACALCGRTLGLQVHHKPKGYKKMFKEDVEKDLSVVCKPCHRRHHRR